MDTEAPFVFTNRDEAFKTLKKYRESRLKCFKTYEEADYFASCGLESSISNDVPAKSDVDTQSNNNNIDGVMKGNKIAITIVKLCNTSENQFTF